jgi:tetratricopeptide (TPR) repeat protein
MKFILVLILLFSITSWAVETESNKSILLRRKSGLTSKITHKRLEKAFRYSRNKKNNKAITELLQLLKQTKDRKYEYATVWQNLGFMLAGDGKSKKAIKALENSLKLNILPYGPTLSSLYTLAQLHFSEENFVSAEATLTEWFTYADEPKAQAYMLMGMIIGQKGKKEKALDYVNKAINLEKNPQEKWLQYALSLNYSLKRYKNALKLLISLTSQYPDRGKYWKQLHQTYLSLYNDQKALAVVEMAYKEGFVIEEKEIINMASLMVFLNMPFKAASIVEKEMEAGSVKKSEENLEFLSQAWYQAREVDKSLAALDLAGNLSKDGQTLAKKGFILLEADKWTGAIQSFKKSLAKGKLKNESKVHFGLGLAHYNSNDLSSALKALEKAQKLDKKNNSIVTWIDQIKNQKMAENQKKLAL